MQQNIIFRYVVISITISTVLVFLYKLFYKKSPRNNFYILQKNHEKLKEKLISERITEDLDSIYIYPPIPGEDIELSDTEKENKELTKYIEKTFPTRFEKSNYNCINCSSTISKTDKHYRCSDCDEYILCTKCFTSSGVEIHKELLPKNSLYHTDEFIYSNTTFPNDIKRRLFHTFSCSEIIKKCYGFYKDRMLIGEKIINPIPPSSFKYNYGKKVHNFHYYSFNEVKLFVEYLAKSLDSLSAKPLDIIGICSENRLEWALVDLCCIQKGFTSAAIPQTVSKKDFSFILSETKLKYLFCSKKSLPILVDVLASLKVKSSIECIICMDSIKNIPTKGINVYEFDFLIHMGKSLYDTSNNGIPNQKSFQDNILAITYTSGSTGCPKAVLFKENQWIGQLSHFIAFRTCLLYGFLPMDHISGRVDLYTAIVNGGRLTLPCIHEGLNGFFADLKELRPTVFGLIPLICNSIHEQFQNELHDEKKKNPNKDIKDIEEQLFEKYRYIFGDRLSSTKVTSAPVSKDMISFLKKMLKVRVSDGYGSTEAGSISRNETVTQVVRLRSIPNLGYSIKDDPPKGEVLVKQLRMASYADKQATQKKIDDKGWFVTGDIAVRTGKHSIRLIDRCSNIIKLSNGDFISVESLEKEYIKSDLIFSIYIYANSIRSHIVAIIIPNNERNPTDNDIYNDLKNIANNCNFRTYELPSALYIDRNLKSWSDIDGLYTSAGKLCRRNLQSYYEQEIDRLYVKITLQSILDRPIDGSKSFKQLGGTSVDAVRLIQQLRDQMVDISFEELMSQNTIEKLSKQDNIPQRNNEEIISISNELTYIDNILLNYNKTTESINNFTTYFITGATGFLGSQLLQSLSNKYPDAIFYCLCRNTEELLKGKNIIGIQGDLSIPLFGLKESKYKILSEKIDCIIHAGFVVNHLVSYSDMYNTNVKSIFDIIKLACFGKDKVKPIHFTSSISALTRAPRYLNGYGSTKWAVDNILKYCKETYNLPIYIYRPCLISGNRETGQINHKDWFHRLLRAIVDFNIVPPITKDEPLNIISADYCVNVIIHLIALSPKDEYQFNITQKNIGWKSIFNYLLQISKDMKQASSHKEWYTIISEKMESSKHPLLPFLTSFEYGIVTPFHSYDNKSLEKYAGNIPILPLSKQDIEKTYNELLK